MSITTRFALVGLVSLGATMVAYAGFDSIQKQSGHGFLNQTDSVTDLSENGNRYGISTVEEASCVRVEESISLDGNRMLIATPSEPAYISCHLVHYAASPHDSDPPRVQITFDEDIVGTVSSTSGLEDTDGHCQRSGYKYPSSSHSDRGLEGDDEITVDWADGRSLEVEFDGEDPGVADTATLHEFDQFRVITCCEGTCTVYNSLSEDPNATPLGSDDHVDIDDDVELYDPEPDQELPLP